MNMFNDSEMVERKRMRRRVSSMRQQCRNLPRNFDQAVGAGVDRQERLLGDTTELRVHRQA